jgi:hypothetical protein
MLMVALALAQAAPTEILHQGRVLDPLGAPFAGTATVTFDVFDVATNGTALHTEVESVTFVDGYFAVPLGPFPPTVTAASNVWVQTTVGSTVLAPRQQVFASFHSLNPGPAGPQGPVGPQGPQGPVGPAGGDSFPTSPQMAMGFQHTTYNEYNWIQFPFTFDQIPVVLATIDETMNESGPVYARQIDKRRDRTGFYSDSSVEGMHWFAIAPGNHTVSGKKVMAGNVSSATNGGTVTFPASFSSPPIVLLNTVTLDNSGAVTARVINSVTTTGFQYYTDTNGDGLDWVAFEPGTYTHGRYRFHVGTFSDPDNNETFSWPVTFTKSPSSVVTIHDTNNSGAVYTRWHAIADTSMRIYIDDNSSEILYYVVFEDLQD